MKRSLKKIAVFFSGGAIVVRISLNDGAPEPNIVGNDRPFFFLQWFSSCT